MRLAFSLAVALAYWLQAGYSLSSPQPHTRNARTAPIPLPPSKDPWYTTPWNVESTSPGTILRIRHAPGNLTTVLAPCSAAYNILYRTTDAKYRPSWAVTTLLVPPNSTHTNGSSSLLSIQVAYDTANVDASPSYSLHHTLSAAGIPSTNGDISDALSRGWYVSVPDYEGPFASFGLGIQAGHATIDSVRAVLSSNIIPTDQETRYAMWGYSGGSIASEWAAELQEQYAPELRFSGAALGGMVPNLTDALDNITASPYAGDIPSALIGLVSQDPGAQAYLYSRLKPSGPYNASYFLSAKNPDASAAFIAFANQDIFDYLIGGRSDLEAPILQKIVNSNGYQGYHGIPQMPVYAYKAIHDEFSKVSDTDALIDRWCGVGGNVLYHRNPVGGHIAEITNGKHAALSWLSSVFAGTLNQTGCLTEQITVNITSSPA